MSAGTVSLSGPGISQAQRFEITDQLARILISSWFRTSSRCSTLLRHVVELAIHGQADRLKERQIAIEAFHRKPTYDNNSDPVVRVAAGEVRKRLAQYYSDPENVGQVRIELPIGSYAPVFHFPKETELLPDDAEVSSPKSAPSVSNAGEQSSPGPEVTAEAIKQQKGIDYARLSSRFRVWLVLAAMLVLLGAAAGVRRLVRPAPKVSGFDIFWSPLIDSHDTLLISVGELRSQKLTFVPDAQRTRHSDTSEIEMSTETPQGIPVERLGYLQAVAGVASVLGAKNSAFDVRDQSETTLADLAHRPTILLGAFDNDWSIGVSDGKRFELKTDYAQKLEWISDRKRPGERIAALDVSAPEPATYEAFSIVMREFGAVSGQPRVLLAGVGDKSTFAAAEFVSNPKYLNDFAQHGPKDWANRNIEFLIQTRVVENVVGIPKIVDYSIW